MKIAFQGEPGAYSEQAVFEYFGQVETQPCESFEAVFEAVISGACESALIPIENSLAGSIHQNYDLLLRHELHITGEYPLRVQHCLIALPGVEKSRVRLVMSHPQALGQCAAYLRALGAKPEPVYDTAGSVKMLRESGAQDTAAIASRRAAEIYGMHILEEGIEDDPENYTRFFLLGRRRLEGSNSTGTKTSIVFATKNLPGALFRCLSVFALRDISLSKIESRPLRGRPWEYLFYLDFQGNPASGPARNALKSLAEITEFVRVLGCYSTIP